MLFLAAVASIFLLPMPWPIFLLVGALVLEVADDGAGFLPLFKEGTGLRNLRERLDALYGDESDLHVATDGEGATVTVTIPINARPTA